jgi:hypothetical protein
MQNSRRQEAYRVRVEAAELARSRQHPNHRANGDEQRLAAANYAMSFTKGLPHKKETGLIADPRDFEAFRAAIDEAFIDPFTRNVPIFNGCEGGRRRQWEAPTAGVVFDLQGPDAQAVTMAPAPALGSDELAYEMAEVYELALLRDKPLTAFCKGAGDAEVVGAAGRLNELPFKPATGNRLRKTNATGEVDEQTLFRGSSPDAEVGPYLSQFMLIGNADITDDPGTPSGTVDRGFVRYGAQLIDQRVPVARPTNYMTTCDDWLAVQNGCSVRDNTALFDSSKPRRFITTPRDLATYVHDDALYQAYLNACLILLSMGAPFDPGFGALSGMDKLFIVHPNGAHSYLDRSAGGFALYGGPHILSLVTEVATRALKAVRYQKFNIHLRLRPEALAGRIEKADAIECAFPAIGKPFSALRDAIKKTVGAVQARPPHTAFLPMAFQEGSPMHPTYGAGHATVAGACVTILKAYFDTGAVFAVNDDNIPAFRRPKPGDRPIAYVPNATGMNLIASYDGPFLTLEGELNKLAANISIGRNMAGVHYYSDYYDSVRMGEEIAIGILEEQALGYPTNPFVLSVPTFDGELRRIGAR